MAKLPEHCSGKLSQLLNALALLRKRGRKSRAPQFYPDPGYPAEAHNGVWWNTVTLPRPKGGRNREYKAHLNTGGVLSTRPPVMHALLEGW